MTGRIVKPLLAVCLLAASLSTASAIPSSEARSVAFKLQTEGMRLYKEGKYREAAEAFRQVVNLNLNSFLAHYYLGASLVADRQYGEAIEPLKIALDLQPDYIQAHLALGDAYLKQGDATEARAEYLRALELQPNYAPAFDGLGRLLESTGNNEAAEDQYRKALKINVAFADAYTHLGDLYLRQDRLDDAIDLFLKAISVKLDFSSAYTRLGVAYARQGRFDDAIASARKSQILAPEDPEAYVTLASIYVDLESYERAESEVLSALAQDHNHPGAHLVLSDLKRAQEDFETAREVLEGLYERGIEDAQMRRVIGEALEKVVRDAEQHAILSERAGATPPEPVALLDLARFLSAQGTHRRAAHLYERAIATLEAGGDAPVLAEPTDTTDLDAPLERDVEPDAPPPAGEADAGHPAEPADVAPLAENGSAPADDEGVNAPPPGEGVEAPTPSEGGEEGAALPAIHDLRFELALEYLAGRLDSKALHLFERLADPESPIAAPDGMRPAALFNMGVSCAELGLHRRAIAVFSAYRRDWPDDPEVHLYLGNAYYRLGRTAEARAAYIVYLEQAGSTPESRQVRDILQDLDGSRGEEGAAANGEASQAGPRSEGSS
jgi:tetratricopeptide (TPR) repeat protein